MDPQLTEVTQLFGRFKAAFLRNDFGTCTNVLSQLKAEWEAMEEEWQRKRRMAEEETSFLGAFGSQAKREAMEEERQRKRNNALFVFFFFKCCRGFKSIGKSKSRRCFKASAYPDAFKKHQDN